MIMGLYVSNSSTESPYNDLLTSETSYPKIN